ncbi:hypothetical protein QR98_0033420 [Sarcoptes scabiei]|uniref:Uncharacterized protein n=1 Tax=Sarcoptes scabiei TaxID=52283 RepID=A0A132A1G9_SARSC|nr:hypothetical protein QR98_0033420 [Sarcoptes scabiei]
MFWSFPRDEQYIRLYSSISSIFNKDFANHSNNSSYFSSTSSNTASSINNNSAQSSFISSQSNQNVLGLGSNLTGSGSTSILNSNEQEWESRSTFTKGLYLLYAGTVRQVMQIGE